MDRPATPTVAPLLVFGWGNPSRGDDALGPMLVEQLTALVVAQGAGERIEGLTDFQLQVEHALDLVGRERVLFVDASHGLQRPFAVSRIHPARVTGWTTHALAPEALLQVYTELQGQEPPPCTLLAIRAQHFELGEAPCEQALADLAAALDWARGWLASCNIEEVPA